MPRSRPRDASPGHGYTQRAEIAQKRLAADLSEDLTGPTQGTPVQAGFDDLGTPLSDVTFVVVDLETTGTSPTNCGITEIGAVKVRGGEVLGEFQTLVDPGLPIPPQITVLTGITQAMVTGAPSIEAALPAFLEFAGLDRGNVLVAHNAPFDVGFLKAAAVDLCYPWPSPPILDTVALARRTVTRDEAPNNKLSTLAGLFGAAQSPDHRALNDARATVDVLHALLERVGSLGVTHLADLATATDPVPQRRRRKAGLAEGLTTGPGVYQFISADDRVLYVGSAVSVYRRVRSYFTAAEKRRRIGEMIDLAASVREVPCATEIEAHVRELRLIAELAPPYNRRSRRPQQRPWIILTEEAHPRLSVIRKPRRSALDLALGPFSSTSQATAALEAIQEATDVRRCTQRLPATPKPGAPACALAELGRCAAPCRLLEERPTGAARAKEGAALARRALEGDADVVLGPVHARIGALADQQRYEEARVERDRLIAYATGAKRTERLLPLLRHPEIIAARRRAPEDGGGWELVLVRYGRLAASSVAPRGTDPMQVVETMQLTGEYVDPAGKLGTDLSTEETELIAAWLDAEGTRLVHLDPFGPDLARPRRGVGAWEEMIHRAARRPRDEEI